jgi:acetoacetyl-CoA synthetase
VQPLWNPGPERQARSRLRSFLDEHGLSDYDQAWEWSVGPETTGAFWTAVANTFGVRWTPPPGAQPHGAQPPGNGQPAPGALPPPPPGPALKPDPNAVPGVRWFPEARLNYAELCLEPARTRPQDVAIKARSQTRPDRDLTWAEFADLTARARTGLKAAGVGPGDCVAGYLPNIPETLALMLAAASLGAVWTCCAPEMGVAGSLDRLAQSEPKVLVSVDGYRYGTRELDRRQEAEAIRAGLPSVRLAVWLPYLQPNLHGADRQTPQGWSTWAELTAERDELAFEPVAFDHPLYILYSSGTTGKPKAIVHGHGGITLEHAKALGLHFDLGAGDTFFWFTTTGWMMWNFCVSGLLVGATVVLFDGDPAGPGGDRLWEIMAETATTCGGVGAGYLVAGMKAGHQPGRSHDLTRLSTLGSTGSPLPAAAAEWVYRHVKPDVLLASFSGGTDVCTGFVGASPLHPVWAGEISCRCLGARVEVFDEEGHPIVGREGELVITAPLPSMPVGIVGDDDGKRYRATYFEKYPGVWAHGDRATLTDRGTVVITGRSDGTLNRGGVRMGTAEFYAVIEGFEEIADSLVVHLEDPSGGPGQLLLFVVPADGTGRIDPSLEERLRATIRRELSPRHVPDRIQAITSVPRTLSGKKLEVPVKRILGGAKPEEAVAIASVAEPSSLDPFVRLAGSLERG